MAETCLLRLRLESSVTLRSLRWLKRVICVPAMFTLVIWFREELRLEVPRRMVADFSGFRARPL